MKKVFITRRLPPIAAKTLREQFEVVERAENTSCPTDLLIKAVAYFDVILSHVSEKLSKDILCHKRQLEVISNYAAGLDNIDLEYARSMGITVYNTPDVVTNSTADLTLALLLALIRGIPQAQDYVRQGKWKGWDPERCLGEELSGKVFGILGFGRVGKAVARRAAAFGLEVIYYDQDDEARANASVMSPVRAVDFRELLEASDYVSIHLPLTSKTRGLINKDTLAMMSKRPVLLNMARGEIAVTEDLVEALQTGKIRGAGLDVVVADEIAGDHPLCQADNVVLVPHIGTATKECRHSMAALAAQNIVKHFQ